MAHLARQARPALSEPAKQRALQLAQSLAQRYALGRSHSSWLTSTTKLLSYMEYGQAEGTLKGEKSAFKWWTKYCSQAHVSPWHSMQPKRSSPNNFCGLRLCPGFTYACSRALTPARQPKWAQLMLFCSMLPAFTSGSYYQYPHLTWSTWLCVV